MAQACGIGRSSPRLAAFPFHMAMRHNAARGGRGGPSGHRTPVTRQGWCNSLTAFCERSNRRGVGDAFRSRPGRDSSPANAWSRVPLTDEERLGRLLDRLISVATERLSKPRELLQFTGTIEADRMLDDLETYPHAFVIACIMARQIRAERAWRIPYSLQQRLGSFHLADLVSLAPEDLERAMRYPTPLHRMPPTMAKNMHSAIARIASQYGGNASAIWADKPSSARIVRRFLEFDGVGQKIAAMAANILVRDFRVPVSDRYSIDIAVDVQVRRVFARMGFAPHDAPAELIVYRARELHPEYPGIFDLVLWELGRTICLPKAPGCGDCHWTELCAHGVRAPSCI